MWSKKARVETKLATPISFMNGSFRKEQDQAILNSAICEGRVWHSRKRTTPHAFHYDVFMFYLDLAEIESLSRISKIFSTRWYAPFRFVADDYLHAVESKTAISCPTKALIERVKSVVKSQLDYDVHGSIRLLTNVRCFTYLINPISVFYVFEPSGKEGDKEKLAAMVLEVTNTPWKERMVYCLDLRDQSRANRFYQTFDKVFDKAMHVSPFMPLNMLYHMRASMPPQAKSCMQFEGPMQIDEAGAQTRKRSELIFLLDNYEGRTADCDNARLQAIEPAFSAGMQLTMKRFAKHSLQRVLCRFPLMTAKVFWAIHWQAIRLWLKRIPFVPHPNKV